MNQSNLAEPEYPASYYASDTASLNAGRFHFRLLKLHLVLLVLLSLLSFLRVVTPTAYASTMARATVAILVGALGVQTLPRVRQFDKTWFDARALAESIKSISWRYMAQAEPYESGVDDRTVGENFVRDVAKICAVRPELSGQLAAHSAGKLEFPPRMREVRALPFDAKKELYTKFRLQDQRDWYERGAKTNRDAANLWFWIVWAAQGLAVAAALLQVGNWHGYVLVPILMTLSAGFVAWSQAKRFDELVNAYGLAAQELRTLEGLLPQVTEATFSEFVQQAEEAISREHTMWYARRGGVLFKNS